MDIIKNLENMINLGQDNALLRYSLGNEYFRSKKYPEAIKHLYKAIEYDPQYSAAWKLYGKALTANHQTNEAIKAFEKGITVAEKKGDVQAGKEMKIFLKRLKNTQ